MGVKTPAGPPLDGRGADCSTRCCRKSVEAYKMLDFPLTRTTRKATMCYSEGLGFFAAWTTWLLKKR